MTFESQIAAMQKQIHELAQQDTFMTCKRLEVVKQQMEMAIFLGDAALTAARREEYHAVIDVRLDTYHRITMLTKQMMDLAGRS